MGQIEKLDLWSWSCLFAFMMAIVRLPHALNMEIYSMYGIDTSAIGGDEDPFLKDGVYSANGDETVPILSVGFICTRGWEKTRFNPSGIRTFIREYEDAASANLLEGRGTKSGAHVDILRNFALIEDIIRVAAGASGEDLGGHRVHSDFQRVSKY
ncbi:Phospholipid:diacylglycerol acyltransferase [Arachis hypogaea]|nr:Phospholipid:diacylglycerol acyltransferase [Arachis hypogaea]